LSWLLQNPELKGKEGIFVLTDDKWKSYNGFCDQVSNDGWYTQVATANPGNNFIQNGDFSDININGWWIDTEHSSNATNTIVDIESPIKSGKALHQTGWYSTEYEIHFPTGTSLLKWDIIKMSAWVADTEGYIFHNRAYYSDGDPTTDWFLITDETKIVNGKTWKYQTVKHELKDTPTWVFNWYIGYGAETDRDLYGTDVKLELFRK
jgi:hypothetical protein